MKRSWPILIFRYVSEGTEENRGELHSLQPASGLRLKYWDLCYRYRTSVAVRDCQHMKLDHIVRNSNFRIIRRDKHRDVKFEE
jgi:hypothetical protein